MSRAAAAFAETQARIAADARRARAPPHPPAAATAAAAKRRHAMANLTRTQAPLPSTLPLVHFPERTPPVLIQPPAAALAAAQAVVAPRVVESKREAALAKLGGARALPVAPAGPIKNPKTGRLVNPDGKVGKQVLAKQRKDHDDAIAAIATPRSFKETTPAKVARLAQAYAVVSEDQAGAFRNRAYGLSGLAQPARTLEDFTAVLLAAGVATEAALPGVRVMQYSLVFEDDRGRLIPRVVHGRTPEELAAAISKIEHGEPLHGSDVVPLGYELQLSGFRVGHRTPPTGGAKLRTGVKTNADRKPKHPHFELLDLSAGKRGEAANDCLLTLARSFPASAITRKNADIRKDLGFKLGAPIPATKENFDAVGTYFRLWFRQLNGFTIPRPEDRKYDDNGAREIEPNRCITKPTLDIQLEGGHPPDARNPVTVVDIYLSDGVGDGCIGHYYYISAIRIPDPCPITGDILPRGVAYTPSEIASRVLAVPGRTLHAGTLREKKSVSHRKDMVLVYDYETVYCPETGELVPYALGWLEFDPRKHREDFTYDQVSISAGVPNAQGLIMAGTPPKPVDLTASLLEKIQAAPPDIRYTLVSFNGARFDHFPLAKAANKPPYELLERVFATDGQLRTLALKGGHNTFDLAKMLPGASLDSLCEDFGAKPAKLRGFSHRVVQRAYDEGSLATWYAGNLPGLERYLACDVLSTASLVVTVRRQIHSLWKRMPKREGVKAMRPDIVGAQPLGTAGALAYLMGSLCCDLPPPMPTHKQDILVRKAVVGGRVQLYENGGRPSHTEGDVKMVDCVSLYPTAMSAPEHCAALFTENTMWGQYPCGRDGVVHEVPDYQPGKLGIYRVVVRRQPTPSILPRRSEDAPLDWNTDGAVEFDGYATQCDIELIRNAGGVVDVHEGHVWGNPKRGLFRAFVDFLVAIKNEQDEHKRTGDAHYNPSLRAFVKVILNSFSGKFMQRNFDDMAELAKGSAAQHAAWGKMREDAPITTIIMGGDTVLIMGKKREEKVYSATRAKAAFVGVFIYSYARAYMWKTVLQFGSRYGDTDSALLTYPDYLRFRAAFPQLDPEQHPGGVKQLGDFEEELGTYAHETEEVARKLASLVQAAALKKWGELTADELARIEAELRATLIVRSTQALIACKDYAILLYGSDGQLLRDKKGKHRSKIHIKGLKFGPGGDRLIDADMVDWVLDLLEKHDFRTLAAVYHGETPVLIARPIDEVLEAYLKQRLAGEEVHVLCSQLTRSYKNEASPFTLMQRFLVKDLTLRQDGVEKKPKRTQRELDPAFELEWQSPSKPPDSETSAVSTSVCRIAEAPAPEVKRPKPQRPKPSAETLLDALYT
jgi:hypothetical protein